MKEKSTVHRVVIIGSGPAGLTAAIYAARAGLDPIIISGTEAGGQLMLTTEVENFPGFSEPIIGSDLIHQMREQAVKAGAEYRFGNVENASLEGPIKSLDVDGELLEAHVVIVATGASARWLDIPSVISFRDQHLGGVTTCAVCDGHFFKGGVGAVVGGGDSAMEEASYLSRILSKVYLIHRRDTFRASKVMQERVLESANIEVLFDHRPVELLDLSKKKVTGLVIESTKTAVQRTISIDALFLAIGHVPNTGPFLGQIDMDQERFIRPLPGSWVNTNLKGVYVAGDVADRSFRQAITAAGMGCMAAIEAERYLTHEGIA